MRRLWIGVVIAVCASTSIAQENPDTLRLLKEAQERKIELANENEKLRQQIAELEKRVADQDRELVEHARQTWFLRSHYASWERFIRAYPRLAAQWEIFLSGKPLDGLPGPKLKEGE